MVHAVSAPRRPADVTGPTAPSAGGTRVRAMVAPVTRFDKLCALYASARARADARRERCAAVLERLFERMRAHLEAPPDALSFRSLEGEPEESPPLPLREAMSTAEDGNWQVAIQIALRDPAQPEPPFFVFFAVRIRETDGRLVLSLSDDDPGREVRPGDDALFDVVAADAHRRLEAWLTTQLDGALGAGIAPERYGAYL